MIQFSPRCALVCVWLVCLGASTVRGQSNAPVTSSDTQENVTPKQASTDQSAETPGAPNAAPPQTTGAGQSGGGGAGTSTEIIQEEVGDRDQTYLRTRAVFRYDYKALDGPIEINRFRLKLLYGFGPNQRLGVSVSVPVEWKDTPTGSAFGSGDTEVTAGVNIFLREKFRSGVAGQVTFQTASEQLIGGGSTKLKGSWGFTYVFTNRFELTAAFNYEQSVHTVRDIPIKQFEPDITLNVRVLRATWFVESDSHYDFAPDRFAPLLKTGLGRAFGARKRWTASVYVEWPLNGYARQTQERINTGLDVTWYPFANR